MTDTYIVLNEQNQLNDISRYFNDSSPSYTNSIPSEFFEYLHWLNNENNPPKSYRDHPILSESQLDNFKKIFEKGLGLSLGAYLRIKRVHYLLNDVTNNCEQKYPQQCQFYYIKTPIGLMLSIFYQSRLCLLEFIERKMLESELNHIQQAKQCKFIFKQTQEHKTLQHQLNEYFLGIRKAFDIPLDTVGTEFQRQVWKSLQQIDYGSTLSYQEEAEMMGKPTAMRAVANANGKNKIAIIIPCHRVIRKNGELGGYGSGIQRKKYLLSLERQFI